MAIPSTFEYPNVFTPNGDEINDKFVIKGFNAACVIDAITIFNRWGERVHKGTDIEHFSWDGKVNEGADAEDGVYFYVVEGKGFKKTGNVTLQR